MKKIIAALLVCLMLLPLMSFQGFAATAADTSWYSDSKSEFTISTPEQLLGLSKLSAEGKNFKGKTIRLGGDIVLNAGTVTSAAPANVWTPLTNFAGTVDGQGYAIRGMYATGANYVGFIGKADGATVKNLSITNSYFATTGDNNVSAFIACGVTSAALTLSRCYTDAAIVSAQYNAGGFVASVGSAAKTTVEECWFDGSITLNVRYAAAIVANGEGKEVAVRHCLNTGTVHTNYTSANNSHIASMIGRNDGVSIVEDCLNLGKISTGNTVQGKSDAIGALFGQCSGSSGRSEIRNSAALEGTAPAENLLGSAANQTVEKVGRDSTYSSAKELTGYNAIANTYLDFENYWALISGDYPALRCFTSEEEILPIHSLNRPVLSDAQLKTEGRYGPRWTLTLDLPEGVDRSDVKVGALIIPTGAIPAGHSLTLGDTSFEYRGNEYEVANVEAKYFRKNNNDQLIASFVVTDLSVNNIRKSFTCVPYAVYTMEDGSDFEMYGEAKSMAFYSAAVLAYDAGDAATKESINMVLEPIEREMGGRFPVREGWSELDAWSDVPAFKGGSLSQSFTVGEDRYDWDCDAIIISEATRAMYDRYLTSLQRLGFTLYTENGAEGIENECYQATLYNDEQTVNVTYYPATSEVFVTVEDFRSLSEHQIEKDYSGEFLKNQPVTLKMMPLRAFGESIIFQLKNGHYIVIDGAMEANSQITVEYLEEHAPEGEIPVVDAWFFTHAHPDHTYCAMGIGENPDLVGRIRVEGFYYTWPNDAGMRRESAYNDLCYQVGRTNEAMKNYRTTDGAVTPKYKLHAGQRFYFAGMEVQILATQDQLFPSQYYSFNCSSTSYRFITEGQELLIMGDAHKPVCDRLMGFYTQELLAPDFFQSLHHTINDVPSFFKHIAPDYWLVTQNSINGGSGNEWLKQNVKKIFYAGDPEIVFPYNG